jgi:hypothetical protein
MAETESKRPFLEIIHEFTLLEGGCDQGSVNLGRKSRESLLTGVRFANTLWGEGLDANDMDKVTRYNQVADAFLGELGRRALGRGNEDV